MGQRIYKVPIENVTIGTAVQDIFSVLTDSAHSFELHGFHLEASATAEASLRVRFKRGTGLTPGSGGTNVTPVPVDSTDPASAGLTIHINDTSQQTGTYTTLMGFQWDIALPLDYLPPPEDREMITVSQSLVLDLPAVIVSTVISGYIYGRLIGA